ncbi:MAG TPA: hypothetical protein PKW33_10990, partial [Anaerolineaceae bacterium]|nr:hypothetical protein [Anaerolineaceae bacterium]HPN52104.1 hypothetical protein [Anaerolineaceae bacterium]
HGSLLVLWLEPKLTRCQPPFLSGRESQNKLGGKASQTSTTWRRFHWLMSNQTAQQGSQRLAHTTMTGTLNGWNNSKMVLISLMILGCFRFRVC